MCSYQILHFHIEKAENILSETVEWYNIHVSLVEYLRNNRLWGDSLERRKLNSPKLSNNSVWTLHKNMHGAVLQEAMENFASANDVK